MDDIPAARTIDGPWEVRFRQARRSKVAFRSAKAARLSRSERRRSRPAAPASVTLDKLTSWSEHPDAGVKYFSGTADLSQNLQSAARRLGRRPVDLSRLGPRGGHRPRDHQRPRPRHPLERPIPRRSDRRPCTAGENLLEVQVTNLPVNRMIGDEQLPEDCDRAPDGQLRSWPKWLSKASQAPPAGKRSPRIASGERTPRCKESGLLGPVKLYTTQRRNVANAPSANHDRKERELKQSG